MAHKHSRLSESFGEINCGVVLGTLILYKLFVSLQGQGIHYYKYLENRLLCKIFGCLYIIITNFRFFIGRLSCFIEFLHDFTLFVVDQIHQIMLISLFLTPFHHFHFNGSAGPVPKLILTLVLEWGHFGTNVG